MKDSNDIMKYYVLPNGRYFKMNNEGVYLYNSDNNKWEYDATLTATCQWDRVLGTPCAYLDETIDMKDRIQAFLSYSIDLFQTSHWTYYAEIDTNGLYQEVRDKIKPDYFPQDWNELIKDYIVLGYRLMLDMPSIFNNQNIKDYQGDRITIYELDILIESLSLGKCANFLMYYFRAGGHHGQEYFFSGWKKGITLKILERMQELFFNEKLI